MNNKSKFTPIPLIDRLNLEQAFGGYTAPGPLPPVGTVNYSSLPSVSQIPIPGVRTPGESEPQGLAAIQARLTTPRNTDGKLTGGGTSRSLEEATNPRYPHYIPGDFNNEDAYAQIQPWTTKMMNGVVKGLALTGTTFLQTTVGLVNGTIQASQDGRFASFYDNDFNRALDDFIQSLETSMPSYETDEYKNANWYSTDYLFTGNFLWEGVVKNLGFAAGAALSGYAFGAGLKGLAGAARVVGGGRATQAITAAEESLALGEGASGFAGRMASLSKEMGGLQNIMNKGYRATVTGLSTTGEAGIEAYHNLNEFRQRAIDAYTEQNGFAPEGTDLEKINEAAEAVGDTSFKMNMGLLAVGNYIQFPRILGRHFDSDKAIRNSVTPKTRPIEMIDGKAVAKSPSKLQRVGRAIKNPYIFSYTEALEEQGQFAISSFSDDFFDKKYREEDTGDTVTDAMNSLKFALEESFSNEGMKNFLIGGFSGAIMTGPGRYRQNVETAASTGKAVKTFNESSFSDFVSDTQDSVMRGLTLEEEYLEALENDDKLAANEAEQNYVINYLMPRMKYGRMDLVLADIQDIRTLASTDAGFQQLVEEGKVNQGDTRENLLARLDNLEATASSVATAYQNIGLKYSSQIDEDGNPIYSPSLIDKMVYAAAKINYYNTEIPKITSELTAFAVDLDPALQGNEVELEKAQLAILDMPDITDDQAENLVEKLNRAAVMNQYKKQLLQEYGDMKQNPQKYKEKPLKSPTADADGTDGASTVLVKTKKYPQGRKYQIGKKYILGNVVEESAKGSQIYRFPSLTFLGENEDGTLKIKDNKGVIRDVDKALFEDYNLGSEEAIQKSPDAKFYLENANKITYWNRGKKKGGIVKGRIKWDDAKDNLVFVYKQGRRTMEKIINVDAFVPKKGYKQGAFYFGSDLSELSKRYIQEAAQSGRTAAKIKARQEARADILTELYVEVSEKHEATEKLIERKKKELETTKKQLAELKQDIDKNAQVDKRYKKAIKFKKVTREAMNHTLKLSRLIRDLEREIEQLEDQNASTSDTLAYIEDLSSSLDSMPDNTRDFVYELKFEQELLNELVGRTNEQVEAIRDLIKSATTTLDSAVAFLTDLIGKFEKKYPDVPRVMGTEFNEFLKANPNFLKQKPDYLKDLQEVEEQIAFIEDNTIAPSEARIEKLQEHLELMDEDFKELELQSRAIQAVLDKFQDVYKKYKAEKAEREAMMLNGELHEEIIGTMDDGVPSKPGNDNYEPDAKKSAVAVPSSTTVSSNFDEPHVLRANRFAFNWDRFDNNRNIKAVVVTAKTEDQLIPGLMDHIVNEAAKKNKKVDKSRAIFAVFVQENADGSYQLVGEDGQVLTGEALDKAVDNAIYQPFPLEDLEANYPGAGRQSMFRQEVPEATRKDLKEQYAEWRKQQLASEEIQDPQTMLPSFGTVVYEQKIVEGEEVDDKDAKNSVLSAKLIEQDDLETTQVLQVATTNDTVFNNGAAYKTPLGRVFLNILQGLVPMNSSRITQKKAEVIYKVLHKLTKDIAKTGKVTDESKVMFKWLGTTVQWGKPEVITDDKGNVTGSKPGYSSVWFDYALNEVTGQREPRLFISGLGFNMPFTSTSLEENRTQIINTLTNLYHNVRSKWVNSENFNVPYNEIVDIAEDGTPVYKTWQNYQTYLLSEEGRRSEEIPLTTNMKALLEEDEVNREAIYFTYEDAEGMYSVEETLPEEPEEVSTENTELSEDLLEAWGNVLSPDPKEVSSTKDGLKKIFGFLRETFSDHKFDFVGFKDGTLSMKIDDKPISVPFDGTVLGGGQYLFELDLMDIVNNIDPSNTDTDTQPPTNNRVTTVPVFDNTTDNTYVSEKMPSLYAIYRANDKGEITNFQVFGADDIKSKILKKHGPDGWTAFVERMKAKAMESVVIPAFQTKDAPPVVEDDEYYDDGLDPLDGGTASADDIEMYRIALNEDPYEKTENWNRVEKWMKANMPHIPFFRVQNLIRATKGRQALGMFHKGAIYVYENAEQGTSYHEVFEAVWKMFTDDAERAQMLDEFRGRKGTFVDRESRKEIAYSEATSQEAKEELAEEFRKFILGREKTKSTIIGKFFQSLKDFVEQILNWFKNEPSKIEAFFKAVDRGQYKQYNPYGQRIAELTSESTISEGFLEIDEMEGDDSSEFSIVSKISVPTRELNDLMQHMTFETINSLFKNDSSLMDSNNYNKTELYIRLKDSVLSRFKNRRATQKALLAKAVEAKDLRRVQQLKKEMGDTSRLWRDIESSWSAIIDRHVENLQTYNIIFDENDYVLLNDENNSGREDYLDSRKIDPFKKSSSAVKLLLASIPVIDTRTGKPKRSSINGVLTMDIGESYLQLMEELATARGIDHMLMKLNKLASFYPNYRLLYRRLTGDMPTRIDNRSDKVSPPSFKRLTPNKFELVSSFWRTFKKQKPDIITVFVLQDGSTIVTDTSLASAAKQAQFNLRNNITNAIKKDNANGLFFNNKGKFTAVNRQGKGFNAVTLNPQKPESYSKFLARLGVEFTPGQIRQLDQNQQREFFNRVDGIKTQLSKLKEANTINKKTLNIEQNLFQLGVFKAIVENEEFQSTYFNVNGEMAQTFIGPNAMSNLFHLMSDINHIDELADTEFDYLIPGNDSFSENSLVMKKLFTSSGKKAPNTSQILKPVYIDGTVNEQTNRRTESSSLKYGDRVVQEINANLKGIYLNLVPGDASIEWAIRLHNDNDPFVGSETFESKAFLEIFRNYLADEINLIREGRNTVKNNAEFRFFKGILPKSLQAEILRRKSSAIDIVNSKGLQGKIDQAIMEFVKQSAQNTKELLGEYALYHVNDGIVETPRLNLPENMTPESFNKQLQIMEVNYMIANIELHKLLYSDPYQYKDELKRIKSFSSPRQALIHGSNSLNEALNRIYNADYEEGDAGWSDMYNPNLRAVTLEDVWSVNKYLAEHSEELTGYNDGYEETDGGGIVSIKGKRKIMLRGGMWNENLERQYRYDIAYEDFHRGKTLTEEQLAIFDPSNVDRLNPGVQELYTPIKPIVSGRKGNERNYNDVMLDKFALLPISYRIMHKMSPESNMLALYNKLQDENVDYAVFESGRKVGAEKAFATYKDGKINNEPFETAEQAANPSMAQTVINVPFSIISIQTDVPTKESPGTTQGSQITKLATLDFMEAGVPIDYEVKDSEGNVIDDISTRYNSWMSITEGLDLSKKDAFEKAEDMRAKESPLYKEIVNNRRLLEAKTNLGFRKLLASLGITKNANGDLRITKRDRIANTLRDEIFSRAVNDNVSDSFQGFLKGDVVLEGTPLYQQIRNILMSITRKNVIRPKINGGFKVQMFNTFFEDNRIELTEDSKGNPVYASGDLAFYRDEDGQRVCEIMVARWFDSPLSDEELIDYLNNTEEGKKLLEGIGYRIPTQKQNSIDAFRIKKFLPKEMKDTVIVPTDLVKKVGSDFDIDKLSVYLKNALGGRKPKLIEFLTDDNSTIEGRYFEWVKDIAGYDTKKYFRFLAKDEVAKIRREFKKERALNQGLFEEDLAQLRDDSREIFENLFDAKAILKTQQDREMAALFKEGAKYFWELSDDTLQVFQDLKSKMFAENIEGPAEIESYLQLTNQLLGQRLSVEDKLNLLKMADNYRQELRVLGYTAKEVKEIQDRIDSVKEQKIARRDLMVANIVEASKESADRYQEAMQEINMQWAKEVAAVESLETLKEFKNFNLYEQNASKNLDNAYIDSLFNLTTHPLNFNRLVVPNSAQEAKELSNEIQGLLGNEPIDYSSPINMLSRGFMSGLRHAFVTGKYAIGISAVAQTNHAQNQRTLIYLDETKLDNLSPYDAQFLTDTKINFKQHNQLNGRVFLSGRFSAGTKKYISDIIGMFIDGYVDISKGPWIMQLGAVPNVAGTWLFLIKAGVPLKDVGYFMNQPIVRQYLKELANLGRSGVFSKPMFEAMLDLYDGKGKAEVTTVPSASAMRKMIGKKVSELDPEQLQQQQFILTEFLKYAKMSEQLLAYIQGSNFDTANFNDPLLVFKKEVQLEIAKRSIISSVEENLQSSFVGNLFDKIKDSRNGFSDLLVSDATGRNTNSVGPREVIQAILFPYVSPYLNDKKFVKLGRKAVENLFDWTMQTGSMLNARIAEAFFDTTGSASTVRQLIEFRDKALKNPMHPMHNNMVINNLMLDPSGRADQIDSVYIKAKGNKVFDQNLIINSFKELEEYFVNNKSDMFDKFMRLAILQSGLTNSYLSFTNLLPYEVFKQYYNDYISMIPSNPTLRDFYDLNEFQRTNPTDRDIVPVLVSKDGIVEKDYGPYGRSFKYWNTATTFMNKNLQKAMQEGLIPKVINIADFDIVSGADIVSWSWEDVPLTPEEIKKGMKPWQKKKIMKANGDYSYRKRGLFKRVYEVDEKGNRTPLLQIDKTKKGEITKYVYKAINTRGFGPRAQEHYTKKIAKDSQEVLGKASIIDNDFVNVTEVSDKKIVDLFYGNTPIKGGKPQAPAKIKSDNPVVDKKGVKEIPSLNARYFKATGRLQINNRNFSAGFVQSDKFKPKLVSLGYTPQQIGAILKLIC